MYIISPSEIAKHPEGKEKTVFSIAIIPKFPSLTSTLDSIKNYRNVQQGAQESNIIQKLTPNEYLPSDHWIMKQELISQNMFNFIHKEHKKII